MFIYLKINVFASICLILKFKSKGRCCIVIVLYFYYSEDRKKIDLPYSFFPRKQNQFEIVLHLLSWFCACSAKSKRLTQTASTTYLMTDRKLAINLHNPILYSPIILCFAIYSNLPPDRLSFIVQLKFSYRKNSCNHIETVLQIWSGSHNGALINISNKDTLSKKDCSILKLNCLSCIW